MNLALGRTDQVRRDVPYWMWKHERNPFGRSLVLLAEQDGRLVGMRSFMRWELRYSGGTIKAAKPVDTVTHPNYRRQGIFSSLTRAAMGIARSEGVSVVFNTPNDDSLPGYRKLGWRSPGRLPIRVRPVRPLRVLSSLLTGGIARAVDSQTKSGHQPAANLFGERRSLEPLLSSLPLIPGYSTRRSRDFLEWRYTQHPHRHYFVETISDCDALRGLLFYGFQWRRGLRTATISDILAAETSTCGNLLRGILRKLDVDVVTAHAGVGTPTDRLLRRHGFIGLPISPVTLAVKPLRQFDGPDPFQLRNWSLCPGDIEGL